MAAPSLVPSSSVRPQDRLVLALDVEDLGVAEGFVEGLHEHVGCFKVGPRLFTRAGPRAVEMIRSRGSAVFLDLKLHDIPETVRVSVREVARLGVKMFTVHALGGGVMMRQAAHELATIVEPSGPAGGSPWMLAVTLLTSHRPEDLEELGLRGEAPAIVERLATLATANGARGIVSSPRELSRLRSLLPQAILVTPGIRGPNDPPDDQSRTLSARAAIEAGADYLVVGRPIIGAPDPARAAANIVAEIAAAQATMQKPGDLE